jgi:hypothetical protein
MVTHEELWLLAYDVATRALMGSAVEASELLLMERRGVALIVRLQAAQDASHVRRLVRVAARGALADAARRSQREARALERIARV